MKWLLRIGIILVIVVIVLLGAFWLAIDAIAKNRNTAWGWSCFGGCFVGPVDALNTLGVVVEADYTI